MQGVNRPTHAQRCTGLTTVEAKARLAHFGRNEIPHRRPQRFKLFFSKLWGPIPWLLEATVVLELGSRRSIEAAIVFALLLINAVIGFFHEHRARDAVEALRSRLHPNARVLRDGSWTTCDARDLVPDDVVHVRIGDAVPADLEILEGNVSVDESVLTGESLPVGASTGAALYSASTIKRGEATAAVRATGTHTKFGLTAELVRSEDVGGHLRDRVFGIVRYLIIADAILLLIYLIGAMLRATPPLETLTFALTLLLGAIPVALPATFTLATALGATQLSRRGVLVTRLSAIEDAAVMDVLCVDKTGTLTENKLAVSAVAALRGASEEKVLRAAALASDPATLDPLDLAILAECKRRKIALTAPQRVDMHPFDPERKYAETVAWDGAGALRKAAKGARSAIAGLCGAAVDGAISHRLAADGQRVLTVAEDDGEGYRALGFIAFTDTLRPDAADLIDRVRAAGVRVLMLTGDTLGTARAVASRLRLGERVVAANEVRNDPALIENVDVVARVLPEDKFAIVQQLEHNGHTCGMTGDGVNDAPALQAAQVGIAVAGATDAAKAAASLVLTTPGLVEILPAIEESRRIFHRLSIYTTNKVTKSLEIGMVLTVAALAASIVLLTPLLMIFLIFGNDFATMAIAADRVTFSHLPEHWSSRRIVRRGATFALLLSAFSFAIFFAARNVLELRPPQIQTLMFLVFVCSSQGLIYLLRERGGFWRSLPSPALTTSSIVDVAISTTLAVAGILMIAIPISVAAALIGSVVVYLAIVGVVYAAAERGSMRT